MKIICQRCCEEYQEDEPCLKCDSIDNMITNEQNYEDD